MGIDGFEVTDRDLPAPLVEISEETRNVMVQYLAAVISGATPEEAAEYLEAGFPDQIHHALDRPGEREEISAHLDILLAALQAPVSSGAGS